MTINKLNYEVYAIDYLDGNLTGELLAEMEQFMLMNPEIAREFDMFNSMVFVPDTSVEYLDKNDMKKPIQFSILNYMNWIVPICMSIVFMAVYPYIREYWITGNDLHPSSQPVKEVPYVQPEQNNTVQLDENTPISSTNHSTTSFSKGSLASVNSFVQSSKKRNSNITPVKFQSKETLTSFQINENNSISENENWDEEEKSTVDFFGKKAFDFDNENPSIVGDIIAMYPNELETKYSLDKYSDKIFCGIGKPTPYLTLSFTPFGIGYDIAKTTNIETQQLIRDLPIDDNTNLVLSAPIHMGISSNLHLSKRISLETGYYLTKRNISYSSTANSAQKERTNIRYINHSIPVNAILALPFFDNHLNVRVGTAINWMGNRNYTLNPEGSVSDEADATATVVRTPDAKLITTNDRLQLTPSLQFGFEYEKDINYGNIAFAVTYNRQMANVNDINIWDYNLTRDERVGEPQTYNMRYETVTASVKYTLPNRWYLNKK